MAEAVYILCAITSVVCAALLLVGYRRDRTRLLLWASVCFAGLAANNVLLFVDLVMVPSVSLLLWRNSIAVAAIGLFLFGLIWEPR
jgi:hypothetical protein